MPDGYVEYSGSGYRLENLEAAWLVSEAAKKGYDAAARALKVYEGSTPGRWQSPPTDYDPESAWWKMTKKLTEVISRIARKPSKVGWSAETVSGAVDSLFGALLYTTLHTEWTDDARGRWGSARAHMRVHPALAIPYIVLSVGCRWHRYCPALLGLVEQRPHK